MVANSLLFTLLSGLVLLGIVAFVLRLRNWRRDRGGQRRPRSAEAAVSNAARSPATWSAGFLLLVLVAVGGALALVGAVPVPESAQAAVTSALLVVGALVLGGFVFGGVYSSVRGRGHGSAPAAGLGSLAVGLLVLAVVVAILFLG